MKLFGHIAPIALAAVVACAAPAAAAPIVIGDTIDSAATRAGGDYGLYSSANFINRIAGGKHWGDELSDPGHPFDTTGASVDRNDAANSLTFSLRTRFNGNDQGAAYADLFLDLGAPDSLDSLGYAIALGAQSKAAGLYTIGSASTSNAIWSSRTGFVYGGYVQNKTTAPGFDSSMAIAPPVRLDTGNAVAGATVSVTKTALADGSFDLSVMLAGIDLSLFDTFDMFWGTADCSNDAIWGTVAFAPPTGAPVDGPPALGLMLLGLLGLAGLRRRPAVTKAL